MDSLSQHTLAIFRGKPFSGKSILASKLADLHPGKIIAISKDVVAESLGLQRAKGIEYTPEVRHKLYTTFRTRVGEALDQDTPLIIAEAPFSRQTDVVEFLEPFRSQVSRILVMTFEPSPELRDFFVSHGRRHPDGSARDLIWFEQQDASSGIFDTTLEIQGVHSVLIDMTLPFSAEQHVRRVTSHLWLV